MPCLFCQKTVLRDVALHSDDSIVHAKCLKRHKGWRAKQSEEPPASGVGPLKLVPRWLVEAQVRPANSSSDASRNRSRPRHRR